ncbi:MAG: amino acid ABC transporter substrate-binding protein [Cyanobacteria bacterium P01_H01_bin.15]
MWNRLGLTVTLTGIIGAQATGVLAESVLEKVKRTGVFTAGTSADARPFAYEKEGQLVGYSVDMLRQIEIQLETELNQDIELKLVALPTDKRISSLVNGDVDIVCDASSFTWERDRKVDFSVSYGLTGTRLLAARGSELWEPEDLAGKKVGVLPGTTNENAIRNAQPQVQLVYFDDRDSAYSALQKGEIDGFASDGVLLEAYLADPQKAEDFLVTGYPYSQEGIACMVPENNSQLLNSVDFALVQFMQGFLAAQPEYVETFEQWFGANGDVPLSRDLRSLVLDNMQLVIDSREEIQDLRL